MKSEVIKDKQKKQFDKFGNTPLAWQLCAEDLLIASQLISEDYSDANLKKFAKGDVDLLKARMFFLNKMLRGMALECIFKALWLKGDGCLAKDGKYLKIPDTEEHNLVSYTDKVSEKIELNIIRNRKMRNMLKRLSLFIFSARYPILKNWDLTRIELQPNGGKSIPTYWNSPSDDRLFESCLSELKNILNYEDDCLEYIISYAKSLGINHRYVRVFSGGKIEMGFKKGTVNAVQGDILIYRAKRMGYKLKIVEKD